MDFLDMLGFMFYGMVIKYWLDQAIKLVKWGFKKFHKKKAVAIERRAHFINVDDLN